VINYRLDYFLISALTAIWKTAEYRKEVLTTRLTYRSIPYRTVPYRTVPYNVFWDHHPSRSLFDASIYPLPSTLPKRKVRGNLIRMRSVYCHCHSISQPVNPSISQVPSLHQALKGVPTTSPHSSLLLKTLTSSFLKPKPLFYSLFTPPFLGPRNLEESRPPLTGSGILKAYRRRRRRLHHQARRHTPTGTWLHIQFLLVGQVTSGRRSIITPPYPSFVALARSTKNRKTFCRQSILLVTRRKKGTITR
jgi:hypothetical protein